jgi:hypothetical protein
MPLADRRVYTGTTRTRAIVSFHSDDGFDGVVHGGHPQLGYIIGAHTTKSFGDAAGTFSITIKKSQRQLGSRSWLRLWPDPEDTWISVKFVVDGQVIDTMLGMIDTIAEDTQRSGEGTRTETYTISGRDFGKAFEQTQIFKNIYSTEVLQSMFTLGTVAGNFPGGTPDKFITSLIDTWLGNSGLSQQPWELPRSLGGQSLYALLNQENIQRMGPANGRISDPTMYDVDDNGGVLWDSLQHYSNGLLNELWLDLSPWPDKPNDTTDMLPAVYFRERPFKIHGDRSKWDSIRMRTLVRGDVQHRQITKGGAANRYNYWMLDYLGLSGAGFAGLDLTTQANGSWTFTPGTIPIINQESIRKHGVRKWQQGTLYAPLNDPDPNNPGINYLVVAGNWLKRCHDWYSPAPMQLSGTLVTTRVMPEIRIGERLRERRREGDIIYYVEGVDHSWSYPGPGQSTITVTHGEYEDENLLDVVYSQFEAPRVVDDPCRAVDAANTDDLINQLSRGCRFEVPTGVASGDDQRAAEEISSTDPTTGAAAVTRYDFGTGDHIGDENGLPQEGAQIQEPHPDPSMVPPDDAHNDQAAAAAEGRALQSVPTPVSDPELDQLLGDDSDPIAGIDVFDNPVMPEPSP